MKNRGLRIVLAILGILVSGAILFLVLHPGKEDDAVKETVGFVMSGSISEEGWNGMHYKGVKAASEDMGFRLLIKENVKEFTGECKNVVKELVEDGAKMIILSSYGYAEEVKDLVKEYPEISFYVNSSEYHDKNMTSYFVRMYQARYLAGILAGMQTKTNQIGYVAAMSNNEVNRGINAFTLGVKSVNPDASVIVAWTNSWDDKVAEQTAVKQLVSQENIDVITYHQNQTHVIEAAEEAGIYSIGYHQAVEGFSEKYITTVACDWKQTYKGLIREFLQGNGNVKLNFWLGMDQDAIKLTEYSSLVTEEQKNAVEQAKTELLSGKEVFSGKIYDSNGTLRCDENENISDEVLLKELDWFVEGVKFYEE